MFGLCEDCSTSNEGCSLYICSTPEGFIVICCIVHAIDRKLSILAEVELDFGGSDD